MTHTGSTSPISLNSQGKNSRISSWVGGRFTTRPAADSLLWMHDRMPLMLPPDAAEAWIRPQSDPAAVARQCLTIVSWQLAG